MKLLLTGASGFLGSQLARALTAGGHSVHALVRSSSDTSRIESIEELLILRSLDDSYLAGVPAAIDPASPVIQQEQRYEAIIHVATAYGRNGEAAHDLCKTNVLKSLQLLEFAFAQGAVFINADTVLPPLMNAYALTKSHFVQWGRLFCASSSGRFINLKLQHFYGPEDGQGKFLCWLIRSCLETDREIKLTLGEQIRDFVHVGDVTSAFCTVIDKLCDIPQGFHEFEIGTGDGHTLRSVAEMVHQLTNSKTTLNFGAIDYRPYELNPCIANTTRLKLLGWSPKTSLPMGLTELIEAIKNHHEPR